MFGIYQAENIFFFENVVVDRKSRNFCKLFLELSFANWTTRRLFFANCHSGQEWKKWFPTQHSATKFATYPPRVVDEKAVSHEGGWRGGSRSMHYCHLLSPGSTLPSPPCMSNIPQWPLPSHTFLFYLVFASWGSFETMQPVQGVGGPDAQCLFMNNDLHQTHHVNSEITLI